jgi:hypothetical protein
MSFHLCFYSLLFQHAQAATSFRGVRWSNYEDAYDLYIEYLSVCTPMYDLNTAKDELSILLGVVCMDVNMIADLDSLRAQTEFPAFWAQVEHDSLECSPSWSGLDEAGKQANIAKIRERLSYGGAEACGPPDNSLGGGYIFLIVLGLLAFFATCILGFQHLKKRRKSALVSP